MSTFFFVLLAAVSWMGLMGSTRPGTFAVGAIAGIVFWRVERARAHRPFSLGRALRIVPIAIGTFVSFLFELLVANFEQLRIILRPTIVVRPRWIRFCTDLETPSMRALFGMMVSLTPGTVTCEERESSDGRWEILVHALDAHDDAQVVERIRSRLEAPLIRLESL